MRDAHFGQGRHMGLGQENKGEVLVLILPDGLKVEHLCLLRSLIPLPSYTHIKTHVSYLLARLL